MQLSDFNSAPASQAADLVRSCAHVDRWVTGIVAGRPYDSIDELTDAVHRCANPWTDAEVDAALARHPRIGERPRGDDADAEMSRSEQAGVVGDDDVQTRLAAGNAAYEAKFGHVFLIRAAGRDADEILAALNKRLTHTPDQERQIAAEQLREIAALRLKGALT